VQGPKTDGLEKLSRLHSEYIDTRGRIQSKFLIGLPTSLAFGGSLGFILGLWWEKIPVIKDIVGFTVGKSILFYYAVFKDYDREQVRGLVKYRGEELMRETALWEIPIITAIIFASCVVTYYRVKLAEIDKSIDGVKSEEQLLRLKKQ